MFDLIFTSVMAVKVPHEPIKNPWFVKFKFRGQIHISPFVDGTVISGAIYAATSCL